MEVKKMFNKNFKNEKGIIDVVMGFIVAAIVIAIIGGAIYFSTIEYQNEETIEITVKDKYVKRDGKSDIYLVASEAGDTYKITDLLWKGKFDSTDLYNQLTIGEKYKVTVTGIRLQYFSMYKNINKIEKVED